jgi:hypothetical protein
VRRTGFETGDVLKGQVGYTRWRSDLLQFWCFSATDLGYHQEERFGEFVISGACEGPRLMGVSRSGRAAHSVDRLVQGENGFRLKLAGADGAELSIQSECDGKPGELAVGVGDDGVAVLNLALKRPLFTRFNVKYRDELLGAVSMRAAVTPIAEDANPPSPRYPVSDRALRMMREEQPEPPDIEALKAQVFPDPDTPEAFFFTLEDEPNNAAEAGWVRVCEESMVRGGSKGGNRRHGYVWDLLGDAARQACREVTENVRLADPQRPPLKEAFNRLVMMEDFYDEEVHSGLPLGVSTRRLIEKSESCELRPAELAKLNRGLLQASIECIHCHGKSILAQVFELTAKWRLHPSDGLLAEINRRMAAFADLYIPDENTHLREGMQAATLGQTYDAVRGHLSDDERKLWLRVADLFIEQHLHSSRNHAWTVTCVPNANAVGNGGVGRLALAVLGEHPGAVDVLNWGRKHICTFMDYCTGVDGGNTEGVLYQGYGTGNALSFFTALDRILGIDDGMFEHPAFTKYMNMIRLGLTNDGKLHGVNDTNDGLHSLAQGWVLAERYGDPFALWYGDHCARMRSLSKANRPEMPECEQPPLPTCYYLKGIQYGVMRSGTKYDCNMVVGVKGEKPPYTHHNQCDAGSFYVHVKGERLLIDPGYHKDKSTDHNLPLINDRGVVNRGFVSRITACEEGDWWRYTAMDSTPAYEGDADRVRRHLVMLGESILVLLDDIVSKHDVCEQLQCGGQTAELPRGNAEPSFSISGKQVQLRVDLYGPGGELVLRPERSLKDTHFGYHQADCRMFPVHYTYRTKEDKPVMMVIEDVTGGQASKTSIRRSDGEISVMAEGLGQVVFKLAHTGWHMDGTECCA